MNMMDPKNLKIAYIGGGSRGWAWKLMRDLADPRAYELLRNFGYDTSSINRCLMELSRRLSESDEFPHEIGLFLGYPPEDVEGLSNRDFKEKFGEYAFSWRGKGVLERNLKILFSHRGDINE